MKGGEECMRTYPLIAPLIEIVFGVVQFFLALRFILKFFGANPAAPFARWAYATSEPLLQPFRGIFLSPVLEGQFVIEFSTLFALLVYSVIAYFLLELLSYIYRASHPTTVVHEHTTLP